jgi:hypothetical protein
MDNAPAPSQTEIAILKTLLYGDIFDFPMTEREIHHYLIGVHATPEVVHQTLHHSAYLAQHVIRVNGYYAMRPDTAERRYQRSEISGALWNTARRYGIWLAYFPFVRMVALTGALAMRNADSPQDDLDYLVVTAPERVWLARLLIVILVRLARLWGVYLCPNYLLIETKLEQPKQDIYVAHELTQMIPISGYALYERMRAANAWADRLMPNAQGTFYPIQPHQPHGIGRWLQAGIEWLLAGRLGDWLENWERRRKEKKFARQAAESPHSSAVINAEQIKGHFRDYGHPVLNHFHQKLRDYDLE